MDTKIGYVHVHVSTTGLHDEETYSCVVTARTQPTHTVPLKKLCFTTTALLWNISFSPIVNVCQQRKKKYKHTQTYQIKLKTINKNKKKRLRI